MDADRGSCCAMSWRWKGLLRASLGSGVWIRYGSRSQARYLSEMGDGDLIERHKDREEKGGQGEEMGNLNGFSIW